jgi:PAS domain S-box-containing protein
VHEDVRPVASALPAAELVDLLDLAHDAILVRSLDGRIAYWNSGATTLYGWPAGEAIGRSSHELLETLFPRPVEEINGVLLRVGAWEGELVHRTMVGAEVTVASRWVLRESATSSTRVVMEINRDITGARQVERRLRESERTLADLFENAPVLIQIMDPAARLRYVNRACRETLGYAEDEIASLTLADVVAPTERRRCEAVLRETLNGWTGRLETALLTRDGREIAVEGVLSARVDGGRPVAVHGFFRDITERKRSEAERERLLDGERQARNALARQNKRLRELDALKDEFLALISHELRTPLATMAGFLDVLLEQEPPPASEQSRYLKIIDRNTRRLLHLVGDLLLIAEIDADRFTLRLEPTDLGKVVAEATESAAPTAQAAGIALRARVPQRPLAALVDEPRIEQLLDNLIGNALKFTPPGGSVTVSCRQRRDTVEVAVGDTGAGIEVDEQPHLFERFFRTRAAREEAVAGCGLGLAIVQAIVERHGGTIAVAGRPRARATFTVSLPRVTTA